MRSRINVRGVILGLRTIHLPEPPPRTLPFLGCQAADVRVGRYQPPHVQLVKQGVDEGTQRSVGGGHHGSHRRGSIRSGIEVCR